VNIEYDKEKMDCFRKLCKEHGLKLTPQRELVYRQLLQAEDHPSAETVFRRTRAEMPNISLDTVNRTLLSLAEIGAAAVVEGSGQARRYDPDLGSHQHFKCVKCQRIIDFHYPLFDNLDIPKEMSAKYKILRSTVYLEGICDKCKDVNETSQG
jgi:Fur family transcriptional regulator, peroxide stress response regulator